MNQLFLQILFYLLLFVTAVQFYFLLFVHLPLARYSSKRKGKKVTHPVSLIVYTKNEIGHLQNHLEAYLTQDYPDFEVVVVKDTNCEETDALLRSFANQYTNLKVVQVPEQDRYRRNKKFALSMGIKAAKNEHLVFIEADSKPCSSNWLREIQENFEGETELVLGHVLYAKLPAFMNLLFTYDRYIDACNRLAYAVSGKAYAGNGRNMAYLKSVFFKAKGFASHMHIPSGEDQLFINQHARRKNTQIEIRSTAQVVCFKQFTMLNYLKEQLNNMQLSHSYRWADLFKIILQSGTGILFYVLLILLVLLGFDWRLLEGLYLFRTIACSAVHFSILKKLKTADLAWLFPFLDLIYHIYLLLLSFILLFKTKSQWN
ncbi:MAG: hypothetical protein RI924_1459 [Bacteroidota bacterium]